MREHLWSTMGRPHTATPKGRLRRDVIGCGLAIALLATALAGAGPAQAHHDFCGTDNTFRWDGGGGTNNQWENAKNWDQDCVPGVFLSGVHDDKATGPYDDVVTIDAGYTVVVSKDYGTGGWLYVKKLNNYGTLTVGVGTKLFTELDSESYKLTLDRGTLGGTGAFTVTKSLVWRGVSTQTTRDCKSDPAQKALQACTSPVPEGTGGRTIIARGATMTINGLGVNLKDQRIIENRGTVTLSNGGYIAADDGTEFLNNSTGRFLIKNNLGYYEGFSAEDLAKDTTYYGPDWANVADSKFTNIGKISKVGPLTGAKISLIAADYSASPTGIVQVQKGTVSIPTDPDTVTTARVKQGAGLGNGGSQSCNDPASCAKIVPFTDNDPSTDDDPQAASVTLTKPGTDLRTVTIEELPGEKLAGWKSAPVHITTPSGDTVADTTDPMLFRFFLDVTLGVTHTAPVYRKADGADSYGKALPSCASYGGPTTSQPACVDRALSLQETNDLGGGDVVLVVASLENSRYRV